MVLSKEKKELLERRLESLKIYKEDLLEKFILGSGSGGQKINKTASCVYLKHIPSQIEVKCQKTRSRELNRYYARHDLCDKIEKKVLQVKTEKEKDIEKMRRQKRKRSKRAKLKILVDKRKKSEIKALRGRPSSSD